MGLNSFLDDQRPQDLLSLDPDWVIDAARDAVETRSMDDTTDGGVGIASLTMRDCLFPW